MISPLPPRPDDEEMSRWMVYALEEARRALEEREVPVGAVVVGEGRLLGRGHNRVEALKDATAHAEILALTAAGQSAGDWRLNGCWLYTTLEPCPMCVGAAGLARIAGIVYGAREPRFGACGSLLDLRGVEGLTGGMLVHAGVRGEEAQALVQRFFQSLRRDGRVVEGGGLENR